MARKKVALKYITNNSTRRKTFQRRSQTLMKKAGEVATLCNAKVCIVIYGEGKSVPQVFSSHDEAVAILNRSRRLTKYEQLNNKMDQERFLHNRIGKLQYQAHKYKRDREGREIRFLVHKAMLEGHMGLSLQDLTNVGYKVEMLLKGIIEQIDKICGHPPVYQPSQAQTPTPYVNDAMETIGASTQAQALSQQQDEWLDLMRSGGGDLGPLIDSGVNEDTTTWATTDLNNDEMMHPFELGAGFGFP